jgi:hypothetical protein
MACQEAMEVYPEKMEANPVEMMSIPMCGEFREEDAAVKPVGGQRKWHRGWNLATECHQEPREWTRVNGGSLRKLQEDVPPCRSGMAQEERHELNEGHG